MVPQGFFAAHWLAMAVCCGACFWVSLCLIIRMWFVHHRAGVIKKVLWSIMLLVPVFGWLAYGAWFHLPGFTDTPCPTEHSRDAPYIGNDHFI